jgi:NitT/TauT family transport system permease protein/sulfonate transport system permease protein
MVEPQTARPGAAGLTSHGLAEGAILLFVLLWWSTARGLPAFVLPGPWDVLRTFGTLLVEPSLLIHVGVSFARITAALVLTMALAIGLGLAARASELFSLVLEARILLVLNSFPGVGWAILGVMWFGVSNGTVIFIQVAIVLPFCLIAVLEGFRQIDAELEEMGRSFTRRRWLSFTRVTLPLLAPFLISGLRVATGIAWKIALVAELFGAQTGLGYLLVQAQSNANAAMVFAICLVIVVIVFALDRLLLRPLAQAYSRNQGGTS